MFLHKVLKQNGKCLAMLGLCLAVFFILPMKSPASPGQLTLTWDSNTEPDIAGYRLYFGTNSHSYDTHTDVGLQTAYTIQKLNQGTYYFVITAYNKAGQESGYSDEVEYCIPPAPTITQVSQISGPSGTEISIVGDNLVEGTVVDFNGIIAPTVLLTGKKIMVAVPDGSSSGPITVTTPGGSKVVSNFTVTPAQSQTSLTVPANGIASYSTIGPSSMMQSGYALVKASGSTGPAALSLLRYSQNGTVSSVAALAAASPTTSARMPIEHQLQINSAAGKIDITTGISIVNTGSSTAVVQFTLRDPLANSLPIRSTTISPGTHQAIYLDQLFPIQGNFGPGSLEVNSSVPVCIAGMRLTVNESGALLMAGLPVSDLTKNGPSGELLFPRMVVGGGYQTTLFLMNNSTQDQSGEIQMLTESGAVMNASYEANTVTPYHIKPGGVYKFSPGNAPDDSILPGWIKIVPTAGVSAPAATEIIGLTIEGVLISEAAFAGLQPSYRARFYVDETGDRNSSFAIVNPQPASISADIRILQNTIGQRLLLPPNGAVTGSAAELLQNALPAGYRGIVEITSSQPFAVSSIQSVIADRGKFIYTSIPELEANGFPPVVFPQFADGSGFQTEFVLANTGIDPIPVEVSLFSSLGDPAAAGK